VRLTPHNLTAFTIRVVRRNVIELRRSLEENLRSDVSYFTFAGDTQAL
jgi:hypothetical protein